jgi:hypothetical protein
LILNEVDELRGRVAELERYLDRYHEMLEERQQWQAERLIHECYSILNLILIAAATGVAIMVGNWLDIESRLIEGVVLAIVWLAATGFGANWSETKREEAIKALPKPWAYIEKPQALKNYD